MSKPVQAAGWMAVNVFLLLVLWTLVPPAAPAHADTQVTAGTEDHERGNLCHPNLGKAPTCLLNCAEAGTTTVKVRAGRYLLHVNTSLARVSTGITTAATDAPFVAGSQLPVTVPGRGLKDYSCRSAGVPLANVCFIPCQ